MTKQQKEIKILKALVHAQDKMIQNYRVGAPCLPESVFYAFAAARLFYKIHAMAEIR